MKRNKNNNVQYEECVEQYFNEIKDYKSLTHDEEYELWKKYKYEKDLKARDKLISANLKFVANIAKNYIGRGLSYSDLISEGNVGLVRALDTFDGEKGYKIISYAVWWIKQTITEALEKRNDLDAEDIPYTMNENDAEEEKKEYNAPEMFIFEENNEDKHDFKNKVSYLLNFLTQKEQNIISEYYGIDGDKPKTLEELGNEYGISKERVRQINEKCLKKLRSAVMSQKMQF